jgi:hypothetical protein
MISSEEFQQKLQAGQIQEALALVVRDAIELDVTTRLTESAVAEDRSTDRAYLRTKINLLTGEIQNEVGKDLVTDSTSYIKLQQLHIDQIVASHRIVQGYLHQIKAILAVLSPPTIATESKSKFDRNPPEIVSPNRLNSDALVAKLTQAAAMLATKSRQQLASVAAADSTFTDLQQTNLDDRSNFAAHIADTEALPPQHVSSTAPVNTGVGDNDIDLSIDRDGAVWEEWIEEEDGMSKPAIPQLPSVSSVATIPDWEEHSVRRQLHPIEIKPIIPRTHPESIDSATQWDKFMPEYIGISTDPQTKSVNNTHSTL